MSHSLQSGQWRHHWSLRLGPQDFSAKVDYLFKPGSYQVFYCLLGWAPVNPTFQKHFFKLGVVVSKVTEMF